MKTLFRHPGIRSLLAALAGLGLALSAFAGWAPAVPGWQYEFPRDHHSHPDFKTEWWYFTGRLTDDTGGVFGYQVTFFRQGLRPPGERVPATSRFVVDDLKFAHFAVSDVRDQRFRFFQQLQRGAFGEAGFGQDSRLAWIGDWSLNLADEKTFALRAKDTGAELDLKLTNTKPWVIHGENGVSQKAAGEGHASHYYSATRLHSTGTLVLGSKTYRVQGESWLDREWASNQLTAEQAGWNWFSIQLDDGTELMLYQMRLKSGGLDPNSSGTFVTRDGHSEHLKREDYQLTPEQTWTSAATKGQYPIAWHLTAPKLNLDLHITTPLRDQELVLNPIAYWEGLIDVTGTHSSGKVSGHGYMELTGYAGALVGLSDSTEK